MKTNKIIKIISIVMVMLMIPFSLFAVSIDYDQTNNIVDFTQNNKGFTQEFITLGNANNKNIGTQTGDIKYELRDLSQYVFILIDNSLINNTINFTYVNNNEVALNTTRVAISQVLTMEEIGLYYIKIIPTFDSESVDILINYDDSIVISSLITSIEPKGFNVVMDSFISVFIELFNINISIWRLGYKLLISAIVLSFVSGLFGIAFLLFNYARKFNKVGMRKN